MISVFMQNNIQMKKYWFLFDIIEIRMAHLGIDGERMTG